MIDMTPERQKILDVLRLAGGPLRIQYIAKFTGKKIPNTSQMVQKLHRDGYLKRVAFGIYEFDSRPITLKVG